MPSGPSATVKIHSEGMIYLTRSSSSVFVNGVTVKSAEIEASNCVIRVIGTVLIPPTGNIVEMGQGNESLTNLVTAVLRASQGDTDVVEILSSNSELTVFAPMNQAFINAGFPDIAAIEAAEPNTLATILTYRVPQGRAFSFDLVGGNDLARFNGGKLKVASGDYATLKGENNNISSKISAVNMVATNGVLHVFSDCQTGMPLNA